MVQSSTNTSTGPQLLEKTLDQESFAKSIKTTILGFLVKLFSKNICFLIPPNIFFKTYLESFPGVAGVEFVQWAEEGFEKGIAVGENNLGEQREDRWEHFTKQNKNQMWNNQILY